MAIWKVALSGETCRKREEEEGEEKEERRQLYSIMHFTQTQ